MRKLLVNVATPPTDLLQVGQQLNVIDLVEEQLPSAGELRKVDDGYIIVYSSDMPFTRQRFTIAHELGHAFIEHTGSRAPRRGADLERICDIFAAELLLPVDQVGLFLRDDLSLDNILRLFWRFQVSRQAGSRRLHQLLGIEFFEITKNREVAFHTGLVREVAWELEEAIDLVLNGSPIRTMIGLPRNRVWNGTWTLEGREVGKVGRALFALRAEVPAY